MKSIFELMDEETPADRAIREAALARYDSPEEVAKRAARRKEDHERGVRLGWWDENGEPLAVDTDDDEDQDEGEEA